MIINKDNHKLDDLDIAFLNGELDKPTSGENFFKDLFTGALLFIISIILAVIVALLFIVLVSKLWYYYG